MPRDAQIEIKSSREIDDIVQELYPDLWDKKHSISTNNNNNNNNNDNNDNDNDNINDTTINIKIQAKTVNIKSVMESVTESEIESTVEKSTLEESKVESLAESIIDNNNVVFKVLKTFIPDIYNLYCFDINNTNLIKHSIALIPNIKISHNLFYTFNSKPNNLGLNMECKFSKVFEKWIPIKFVNNNIFNTNIIENIENKLKTNEQ